uniref:Uncharacterized protein n=1 Tax=Rhizophora mucronata TaxID=61149 RepID=A0A2P2KYL4_RHIMU
MVHKGLLGLVMLFLVCSHVLSSVAVPATSEFQNFLRGVLGFWSSF